MNIGTRSLAVVVGAAVALVTAGCGGDSGGGAGGSAENQSITIGIKYDQPGLGQKEGDTFKGLDVDVAKYVAKELGYEGDKVVFKETPSAQRETAIQGGQVSLIFATYSITDERKQKVSFAGPYFVAGQDLLVRSDNTDITGPDTMNGKTLCSVTGSTPAENIKKKYATSVKLFEQDTYSKCVEALVGGSVDAVTTDNVILAGFAAQPQYEGKLKVVGKPFSTEKYGVGLKKGDTATCEKVNAALQKMVSDGSWQKAIDDNVGPSGFKVDTKTNPPKPEPCS
ncbi:MAG TPA: glutamate ABC transporter substrate-binding protein [Propionibacteriaceae bacterium]|nr:glutamate ABC transporter substrate-binding protein [Propionibacteriaceae bacterium]